MVNYKQVYTEYEYTFKPMSTGYSGMQVKHEVGEIFNIPKDALMKV